jgi:2-oxoglutarate dehydrogenase E2 component (dihydrolipoamide succinyltransferase)
MPVNVVMPQMGESVTEGTVVRWIRKVGDLVGRDEPLFEISTDKVDAEIPSPAAGTLAAIHVKEGETVPVDAVVAVIAQAGEAVEMPNAPAVQQAQGSSSGSPKDPGVQRTSESSSVAPAPVSLDEARRLRSSPLVRRIAGEHHIDIASIPGSGIGGRVTKHDILRVVEGGATAPPATTRRAEAAPAKPTREGGQAPGPSAPIGGPAPDFPPGERSVVAPFSVMRRKIAEHMVFSQKTAAHVHSVFEVDFTHVSRLREAKKADYERAGVKLTFLSFIAKAVADALVQAPILNASHDGDRIVYHQDVNLGIAVALDWGLIVPVIARAHEKSLLDLSRAIADLAARARAKKLKNEEVHGGTFTITNPGTLGAQFGLPIINQPQLGILGVGTIEKRPVVIDDGIAIRLRSYLTLGFDHRLIDGIVADQFLALVKDRIERFDPAAV